MVSCAIAGSTTRRQEGKLPSEAVDESCLLSQLAVLCRGCTAARSGMFSYD